MQDQRKEPRYYKIKSSLFWSGIVFTIVMMGTICFRDKIWEEWQKRQERIEVSYEGLSSKLEDTTSCYLCGSNDKNFTEIGLIFLNDWYVLDFQIKDYNLDSAALQKHLCQPCLDKVTNNLNFSKGKYEKKNTIPLCLVDFQTLEIYSLQDWHVGCSIRDYWAKMDYQENIIKVEIFYLPER